MNRELLIYRLSKLWISIGKRKTSLHRVFYLFTCTVRSICHFIIVFEIKIFKALLCKSIIGMKRVITNNSILVLTELLKNHYNYEIIVCHTNRRPFNKI